ncbi:putative bolA-like protein K11H12.1 [Ixodes scapularis]|uniref:putative bolA-like protein K11H12.1 n=1 Tax=Ixodes scapularis TaxID=6945 RepID=UPI0011255987|nr:putative bolA-like protein K11H12.1 [Ixodes scapularis]XP_029841520.3 putative bolA-like protein K11H12.1 [Ixodes scapularis]
MTMPLTVAGQRMFRWTVPFIARQYCSQSSQARGQVQRSIEEKLSKALNPTELLVENESHMHNVPKGSETHFRVTVVSASFEGKSLVQQHALVYGAVKEELQNPVHALAIETSTPAKWKGQTKQSPPCLGGMKSETKHRT